MDVNTETFKAALALLESRPLRLSRFWIRVVYEFTRISDGSVRVEEGELCIEDGEYDPPKLEGWHTRILFLDGDVIFDSKDWSP